MSQVTRFGPNPLLDQEIATKSYVDAGGGGGQTFARKVKTVDETIQSDIVVHDDDELFIPLTINRVFGFLFMGVITSAGPADFKWTFTIPSGATGDWFRNPNLSTDSTAYGTTDDFSTGGGSVRELVPNYGRIIMGGTGGDIQFQWAQRTSTADDTIVRAGSSLVVWEEV